MTRLSVLAAQVSIFGVAAACRFSAATAAPCATPVWPPASGTESAPRVVIWTQATRPDGWQLDPCVGWQDARMTSFAVVAGTFATGGNLQTVLARLGAISRYAGLRYWSVKDGRLETLITAASAVQGPEDERGRADFTPADMQVGRELFFTERDNRLSAPVLYRMRVVERAADRVVVDITNVTKLRVLLFTLFGPGDLHTALFISRSPAGTLTCYALSGFHPAAMAGLIDTQKSHANRLLALYGHLTESQDDGLPWSK